MSKVNRSRNESVFNWKRWAWSGGHIVAIAACLMLATAPNAMGIVTGGADFNVDASLDTDGDDRWEDTVGTTGFDLELDDSAGVVRVTGTSALPGISAAYSFPGGSINNVGGALLRDAGTSTDRSFQNAPGDFTDNEDVTIEIWFKPNDLTPSPANGQILFEDGGGTGFGFFVDDGELKLRKAPGGGTVSANITGISNEFIQAIGTYDASAGTMELFINGSSVGTASPGGNDWSGGDPAAIGTRGGANTGGIGGGQSNTESFDGEISIFRLYRNAILNDAQVAANYNFVTGASGTPSLNYDGGDDDGANNVWENTGVVPGFNITNLTGQTFDADASDQPGITGAYNFTGSGSGGDLASLDGLANGNDISFEMWFRPTDLVGDEVLFETGGGNGIGISLGGGSQEPGIADSEIVFSVTQNSGGNQTARISADLSGLDLREFIQVVSTFDITTDTATLFVNGMQVGQISSVSNITDWTGGDGAGIGMVGGANMGGYGNGAQGFSNFDGEIGIFRVYQGHVLTGDEVFASFKAIDGIPEPATAGLLAMGIVGLIGRRSRRRA